MQAMLRKILIFNSGSVPVSNLINTPGGYPSGVIAFYILICGQISHFILIDILLFPIIQSPVPPGIKRKAKEREF